MDVNQISLILAKLGIAGVDPSKVLAALELAKGLGGDMHVSAEEYLPRVDEESFYVPNVPKNFYYDPKAMEDFHKIDYAGLRKLSALNLRRLRR